MAETNINAYCSICGKGYTRCNSCADQKVLNPWKSVTDTMEHYKIYLALHGYTLSKNKEDAKKELENCDLSGLTNFKPEIQSAINEIMAEPKKIKYVSKNAKANEDVETETEDINEQ